MVRISKSLEEIQRVDKNKFQELRSIISAILSSLAPFSSLRRILLRSDAFVRNHLFQSKGKPKWFAFSFWESPNDQSLNFETRKGYFTNKTKKNEWGDTKPTENWIKLSKNGEEKSPSKWAKRLYLIQIENFQNENLFWLERHKWRHE